MTFYELEQMVYECFDEETGVILDEEKLAAIELERDKKIEGLACFVKSLKAEAKAIKDEEDALKDRRQKKERKAESISNFLENILAGQKFETSKVAITWRKSESVEIAEGATVPEQYIKYEPKVIKTDLKKALKEGACFDGIALIQNNNMTIK